MFIAYHFQPLSVAIVLMLKYENTTVHFNDDGISY
jgi:hypothetical protein